MAEELHDEWELGSGLAIDGATVTVIASRFGVNNDYSADAVCWLPTFADGETGETKEELFSIGKGWEIAERGERIEGGRKINNRSRYGRWIAAAMELDGVEDFLRGRGSPRNAGTWTDTVWTVKVHEEATVNPETKAEKVSTFLIPVEFHGTGVAEAKSDGGGKKADAKPAKGAAKAAAKEDKPAAGADLDPEVRAQLLKIAVKVVAKGGDHDVFADNALDIDEIAGNKAAVKAVQASGEGSVWAEASAE